MMRRFAGTALILLLAACSGDAPVTPTPKAATCDGVSVAVRTLAPLERVVLSGADAACFALAGDNKEYLVVPQLTGAALPYGGYGFRLGDPTAVVARTAANADEEPIWLRAASGAGSVPFAARLARRDRRTSHSARAMRLPRPTRCVSSACSTPSTPHRATRQ